MQRVEARVSAQIKQDIDQFQERYGYKNKSQAIRELLRRGLNCEAKAGTIEVNS